MPSDAYLEGGKQATFKEARMKNVVHVGLWGAKLPNLMKRKKQTCRGVNFSFPIGDEENFVNNLVYGG